MKRLNRANINRLIISNFICLFLFFAANSFSISSDYKLTILYTNDEHGWIEPDGKHAGASNLSVIWQKLLKENNNVLILSGGDNFAAGPSLTIDSKGNSTASVFKEMGYLCAPVGNHEFDFGVDAIKKNAQLSSLKYLSSNIINEENGVSPDFAVPYIITEVGGKKIGIIGLSNIDTPTLTNPKNLKGFKILTYIDALNKFLPELKKQSDIVLILIHDCSDKIQKDDNLLEIAKTNNISFIGTGHCHQVNNIKKNNIIILETGSELRNYGKVDLTYNEFNILVSSKSEIIENKKIKESNPKIDKIIADYANSLSSQREKLREIIGINESDKTRESGDLYELVFKSWFKSIPEAEISFFNKGSIRQDFKKGNVSTETIKTIMPFENNLFSVDIKGKDLTEVLKNRSLVIGMNSGNGKVKIIKDLDLIKSDKIYKLLIPDFLYNGGDKVKIKQYCPEFKDHMINYSQPLINYFKDSFKK